MKRLILFFNVIILMLFLTSCAKRQNLSGENGVTLTTADVLSSQTFNGDSVQDVVGGQLLSGLFDQKINRYMDRQDAVNLQNAMLTSPVGKKVTWRNQMRQVTYTVQVRRIHKNHQAHETCRDYEITMMKQGTIEKAIGSVCQDIHG